MYAVQTSGSKAIKREAIKLQPLTPAWRELVIEAATDDQHLVIAPTHAVVKGGKVIGYGSLGAVPMFFAWMHRRQATARDSFTAWQLAEAEMKRAGIQMVCMPCEAESPFAPFIQAKGYQKVGSATINLKGL
jgi:hypothetical protein